MSISKQVQEHLNNGNHELRSIVQPMWEPNITQIAELLSAIDKVATVADIMDHLDNMKAKGDIKWKDFE